MVSTAKEIILEVFARIFGWQARRLLTRHDFKIIGITGSFGKTSTKLAVAEVLETTRSTLAYRGNYNNELGFPLQFFNQKSPFLASQPLRSMLRGCKVVLQNELKLRRRYPYDVAVLELGADRPGDIKRFMEYLEPHLGVITAVAAVHLELFKSVDAILKEKWALAEGSRRVLINKDDSRLVNQANHSQKPIRSYGINKGDYAVEPHKFKPGNLKYRATFHLRKSTIESDLNVVGKQSLYPLLAAAAVGEMFGVPERKIKSALQAWRQPKGRMHPLRGLNRSIIIDDSYNSSPDAALSSLDALYQFSGGRKIAVLGNMNELGPYLKEGHQDVGKHASNVDMLVTIGHWAKNYLAKAAYQNGLEEDRIHSFMSPVKAGEFLQQEVKKDDVILVKGSQNSVYAEETVKLLLDSADEIDQLVRQSQRWKEIKQQQFPEIAFLS